MGTQVEHEHRAPRPPACGNSAYYPRIYMHGYPGGFG